MGQVHNIEAIGVGTSVHSPLPLGALPSSGNVPPPESPSSLSPLAKQALGYQTPGGVSMSPEKLEHVQRLKQMFKHLEDSLESGDVREALETTERTILALGRTSTAETDLKNLSGQLENFSITGSGPNAEGPIKGTQEDVAPGPPAGVSSGSPEDCSGNSGRGRNVTGKARAPLPGKETALYAWKKWRSDNQISFSGKRSV